MANDAAPPGKNSANHVTVSDPTAGKSYDLPVMDGTMGPRVIDVRKLYTEHDVFTYDPGFTSTASCESKITYIDGEKGILLHRGYPIEELAEKSDFLEVCYLLLYGELPNPCRRRRSSARTSPITRCCMSRSTPSIAASGAMRIPWR